MQKVSIVIPVYNQLKVTMDCLGDLIGTHEIDMEIILVDDGSTEPISRIIPKVFPQVNVNTISKNQGFAKTVNFGIKKASNNLILLLNNDVRLPNPKWLRMMVDSLNENEWDLTSPAFGRLSLPHYEYLPGEAKTNKEIVKGQFTYPVGWCLLVRKEVFSQIGLIPENFGLGFFDDVLFSYRAQKMGFKMGISEGVGVSHAYHTTFKSRGIDLMQEYKKKREIFLKIIKEEEGRWLSFM